MNDSPRRPRIIPAVLLSGLVVGLLDGVEALIFFSLRGLRPASIFQFIATSLLGQQALQGGGKTLAIGILLHFCVATSISIVFVVAAYLVPALIRYPFVTGPLFGIVAYFMMTFVVVPFFIPPRSGHLSWPVWPVLVNGILGHAFLIGLPIALITRWSAGRS